MPTTNELRAIATTNFADNINGDISAADARGALRFIADLLDARFAEIEASNSSTMSAILAELSSIRARLDALEGQQVTTAVSVFDGSGNPVTLVDGSGNLVTAMG